MVFSLRQTKKWKKVNLLSLVFCLAVSPLVLQPTLRATHAAETVFFLKNYSEHPLIASTKQKLEAQITNNSKTFSPIKFGTSEEKSTHNTGHVMQKLYGKMDNPEVQSFNASLGYLKSEKTANVSTYIATQIISSYQNLLLIIHQEKMDSEILQSLEKMQSFYDLGKAWLSLVQVHQNIKAKRQADLEALKEKFAAEKEEISETFNQKINTLSEAITKLEAKISDLALKADAKLKLQTQLTEKQAEKTSEERKKAQQESQKDADLKTAQITLEETFSQLFTIFDGMCSPYGSYSLKSLIPFYSYHRGDNFAFHNLESQITPEITQASTVSLLSTLLNSSIRSGHNLLVETDSVLGGKKQAIDYISSTGDDVTSYLLFSLLGVDPNTLGDVVTSVRQENIKQELAKKETAQEVLKEETAIESAPKEREVSSEPTPVLVTISSDSLRGISLSPHIIAATTHTKEANSHPVEEKKND